MVAGDWIKEKTELTLLVIRISVEGKLYLLLANLSRTCLA